MKDLNPSWLDEMFLKQVLKSVEDVREEEQISISRWQCNLAVPPGCEKIFKPSGELRFLNHGDCWSANALFKYNDSNKNVDDKLVDFQMVRVGSFAQDVIKFWWSSARQDLRENLQEEMFEVYRKTLNRTLEDVEMSERVSKEDFDNEIRRFSPYALPVCSNLLTVVMADPEDLLDTLT